MRVLAIDSSFEACSTAILDEGGVRWRELRIIGRGHAEALPVMVAEGLDRSGLKIADIDRVGVVIGPGAFAGVRVGLAFARALCLGTKAVAIGVTSLEALAASVDEAGAVATVFDARRGQVYAALYDADRVQLVAPFVGPPAEAARRVGGRAARLAGSGAALVAPHLDRRLPISAVRDIDPAAVARLAMQAENPAAPPAPLYLRPPDAIPSARTGFGDAAVP
ncbi:MAG: tRNA (adenosine(37)-N6)-threonylcarbamoyltransferase complex dimerization subunit type 1 TsaB [Parvularculaceae bacterium]|nr:tRNA (adenosine(37)-N6)-threonylcarbamoyltransferase complex dimerization subunit type 1 TsaB [Parvularculaceae bacterium]